MPITVSHALSATTPDDPQYEIRPSHWNSNHLATFNAVGSEISGAFSNAGNVTFGLETNGFITASANAAGAGDGFNRIAAGTQTAGTNNTIVFSNSNGITFGMSNSSVVTASYTVPSTAGLLSAVNVSAGTTSNNLSALTFSNANGVTFGLNASTVTASVASQTVQTQNMVSVLGSTGNISFANGNGITFGGNASTITASHNGLTTARASNDAIGLNTAQSNVTWTANSAGLSLDARGYAGTATAITGGAAVTLNSGGLSFNGASLAGTTSGFTGANISASITHNTAGLAMSMSVAAPGGGGNFSAGVSNVGNTGGDTGVSGTRLVLVGSQNITLNQATDANGLTVSISGGAGAAGNTGFISAGANTASLGTVVFSNSNGVSFGANGQTITASHNGLTQQSTQPVAVSAANGSYAFSTLSLSNANGISFGTSAGSAITASYTVPTVPTAYVSSVNGSSGAISFATGSSLSSSSNGSTITWGLASNITTALQSAGAYLTTAALPNHSHGFSASGGSSAFQTLNFANSNGFTFSNSNGSVIGSYTVPTVTDYISATNTTFNGTNISGSLTHNTNGLRIDLSVAAGGGGLTPVASASNGSFSFTTLNFSNANNVTFGTSAGSIITASVAAPGAAAERNDINLLGANTAGNTTASGSTIGWSGINLTLSGTNNSVVNISAPATSSLSATGLLSISTNGSTISMGVGRTVSGLVLAPFAGLGGPVPFAQSSISLGQNSLYMYPVQIEDYLTCDHFRVPVLFTNSSSAAASVQKGLTYQVGVYTRHSTNSTLLSRHYSSSYTMAASHSSNASWGLSLITGIGNSTSYNTLTASSAGLNLSASLHGPRELIVPVSSLFTPGEYVMAMLVSSSSVGAGGAVLNNSNMAVAYQTFNQVGASTNATGSGFHKYMNMGTYSATTGALPASISATQINQLGTMPFMFAALGTV